MRQEVINLNRMKKIILLTAYCLLLTPMIATLAWADGWVTQTTTTSAFYDVYALEERVCFAVGQNGLVAGTSNMGATWNTSTFSSGVSNLDWYDVHFNNASQGFIVGESGSSARVNYVSSTGSFELSAASVAFPLTAHLYGCYYFSATSIFAVGAYSGAGEFGL